MKKHVQILCCLHLILLLAVLPALGSESPVETQSPVPSPVVTESPDSAPEDSFPPSVSPPVPEPTPPESDAPPNEIPILSTAEALRDWLDTTCPTGGQAQLGANIAWPYQYLNQAGGPVNLLAGPYTITLLPGSAWEIHGPIAISGTATVFDISDGAMLTPSPEGTITAEGNGAIAVLTRWPNGVDSSQDTPAIFFAEGDGAAALSAPAGLDLRFACLTATGGGAAIEGRGPVDLTLCTLYAEGDDAQAIRTEHPVLLDTCSVTPEFSDAESVTRTLEMDQKEIKYSFSIGGPPALPTATRLFLRAEGREDIKAAGSVIWALPNLDPTREGAYSLSGKTAYSYQGIHLEGSAACTLYMLDASKPRLINAEASPTAIRLYFYRPVETQEPQLQYSTDGGTTWEHCIDPFFSYTTVSVGGFPSTDETYLFRYIDYDAASGKQIRSNILTVVYLDNAITASVGDGDWDGGDYEEQTPQPPPFSPSPPSRPNKGGESGEDSGGNEEEESRVTPALKPVKTGRPTKSHVFALSPPPSIKVPTPVQSPPPSAAPVSPTVAPILTNEQTPAPSPSASLQPAAADVMAPPPSTAPLPEPALPNDTPLPAVSQFGSDELPMPSAALSSAAVPPAHAWKEDGLPPVLQVLSLPAVILLLGAAVLLWQLRARRRK